jgi:signal transduction histidine kinase
MRSVDRRFSILVSLGYLAIGVVAWRLAPIEVGGPAGSEPAGGSMLTLWAAAAVFAVTAWIARDRLGWWLIPAMVGPLALQPLTVLSSTESLALLAVLWPVSALPLGLVLAERRSLRVIAAATGLVAVVLGQVVAFDRDPTPPLLMMARYLAVIGIVALPGAARIAHPAGELTAGRIIENSRIVASAVAPAIAGLILVAQWEVGVVALASAFVAIAVGSWVAVRPLTWLATRASVQRDLAVSVSEAERTRLAADLHDGPLQNVLLLARHLDESGDKEGADLARAIGVELRELSGDLRLPLLDDLGVGPAIEWLTGRVRRMTATDIQVAIAGEGRVPAAVELAAFRVAQEAIANAIRHGSPPILVRCRTTPGGLSLSVEDAGADRVTVPPPDSSLPGRLGLLNMQQRADQVGARLEWMRPERGGTIVAFEWRAVQP